MDFDALVALRDRVQAEPDRWNRTEVADGWTPVTLDTLDIPAAEVKLRARNIPLYDTGCIVCGWDLTVVDIGGVCRQCRLSYHSRGNDPLPPWRMA